jgi:hypothetical protein
MTPSARELMVVLFGVVVVVVPSTFALAGQQTIGIRTNVAGATCILTSPGLGKKSVVSPATLVVDTAWSNITVRCSKECYADGVAHIRTSLFGGYDEQTLVTLMPAKVCPSKR